MSKQQIKRFLKDIFKMCQKPVQEAYFRRPADIHLSSVRLKETMLSSVFHNMHTHAISLQY